MSRSPRFTWCVEVHDEDFDHLSSYSLGIRRAVSSILSISPDLLEPITTSRSSLYPTTDTNTHYSSDVRVHALLDPALQKLQKDPDSRRILAETLNHIPDRFFPFGNLQAQIRNGSADLDKDGT